MKYRIPLLMAFAGLLFSAAHLTFEHFTGGVQSHHLLARPDLPEISNWFGMLVLPLLGWLAGLRVRGVADRSESPAGLIAGFVIALLYGAALASGFEFDQPAVTSTLFFGLFAFAVVLPIYRAECIFGFVVGMTFTFGSVLPTLIASVFALISALLHPLLRWVYRAVRRQRPSVPVK